MGYKYRNGSTPDHVDSGNSNSSALSDHGLGTKSDTTKAKADTASDMDVRRRIEKKQGTKFPNGGGDGVAGSAYGTRTDSISRAAANSGALGRTLTNNNPTAADKKQRSDYDKSEKTDLDLRNLSAPAAARAKLKQAEADSAASMKRLKKS